MMILPEHINMNTEYAYNHNYNATRAGLIFIRNILP